MINNDILVSIVIVSYNSANTIVETLDSVKNQNYKCLELIISDDSSQDNTVKLCNEWLETNKDRFNRTVLLTSERNQGICVNSNRGWQEATGKWIKGIAADDIMCPACISSFMEYVDNNPEAQFISSYMSEYKETFDESNCVRAKVGPRDLRIFKQPIDVQLKVMAWQPFVWAPTIFTSNSLFQRLGGFDNRYEYEDHPFWLKVLEFGHPIHFLNKVTVCYRINQSFSHSSDKLFNYNFLLKTHPFILEKCYKYYGWRQIFAKRFLWAMEWLLHKSNLENRNFLSSFIYDCTLWLYSRIGSIRY